jgi:hypothetical protein
MIPPKPERFAANIPPPGVTRNLVAFNNVRVKITPRLQLVHTNGASKEGNIASAKRWAEANPGSNTCPHFQVDRDGSAGMLLELDRKGIGNYKAADWSWVIETADTGYLDDPTISEFTGKQAETVAIILAYGAVLYKIPLAYPATWDGAGTACHTEPFGYPLWTNAKGKICPGQKKKAQMRDLILPRAREIVAAWTAPVPKPDPEQVPPPPDTKGTHDMWCITKTTDGPHLATSGLGQGALHVSDEISVDDVFAAGGGYAIDFSSGKGRVIPKGNYAASVAKVTKARALELFGAER